MSWLGDRMIQYLYKGPHGEEAVFEFPAHADAPEILKTSDDGDFKKVKMLPYKTNLTFVTVFDRNGTVGYRIDSGNGKPRTVSATRLQYEKTVGNMSSSKLLDMKKNDPVRFRELSKSVTTKGYKEKFMKVHEAKIKGAK